MRDAPSLRYFMRVVRALADHQEMGLSRLVAVTGINHQRCALLLDWMEERGYLAMQRTRGKVRVAATEDGLLYIKKLLSLPLPSLSS